MYDRVGNGKQKIKFSNSESKIFERNRSKKYSILKKKSQIK